MKSAKRICSVIAAVALALSCAVYPSATPEMPSAEEIAAMPEYDGRDYGVVTPVKNQGSSNLCWVYSSIAASEISILKSKVNPFADKDTLSLNPVAAAYRVYNRGADPLGNTSGEQSSVDYLSEAGNPLKIAKLFSMWWGPVESAQTDADPFLNPSYRFENAFYIPRNRSDPEAGIKAIKTAIAKYGAVTFQYNNVRETYYYNPKNESGSASYPHACTIIGWNDNIAADSFVPGGATRNGGWLVKNSYNSLEYFYLSYDNTSTNVYAFTYAPVEKYDYNYYYDGSLEDFALRNDKTAANVYQAQGTASGKDEFLKAVNVGVLGENVTLQAEIYISLDSCDSPVSGGYCASKTTAFFEHGGYVTVELNEPVKLEKDEWFSVVVSVSNESGDAKIITAYKDIKDLSFAKGGGEWQKMGNFTPRIKAYTKLESSEHGHSFGEWTLTKKPTVTESGESVRTCSVCGETEYRYYEKFAKNCVADGSLLYGFHKGMKPDELADYLSSDYVEIKLTPTGANVGTGSFVSIDYPDGETLEYKIVIFGDVDGDGLCDGQDAVIASCIDSGLLTAGRVGTAAYRAADCNRDGVRDDSDVELLNRVGLLFSDIEQGKS